MDLTPTSSRVALPYCCGTNKLKFTPATGLEKRRCDQAHFKINFVKSSQSPSSENHKNKQEPGCTDMDVNQHVSNIKLVNYVLESVPRSVVESHELCAMSLEYRKECNVDSVLQSLCKISGSHLIDNQEVELDHSLSLDFGPELVRRRTRWRKKLCAKETF